MMALSRLLVVWIGFAAYFPSISNDSGTAPLASDHTMGRFLITVTPPYLFWARDPVTVEPFTSSCDERNFFGA